MNPLNPFAEPARVVAVALNPALDQSAESFQHLLEQIGGGGRVEFWSRHVEIGSFATDGIDQLGVDPSQAIEITAVVGDFLALEQLLEQRGVVTAQLPGDRGVHAEIG